MIKETIKWSNGPVVSALDFQSRGPVNWMTQRSTESYILPRSIKRVSRTPGDLVVKRKLSPRSGSVALGHLTPVDKKGP